MFSLRNLSSFFVSELGCYSFLGRTWRRKFCNPVVNEDFWPCYLKSRASLGWWRPGDMSLLHPSEVRQFSNGLDWQIGKMTCAFVYLFSKRANPLPALSMSFRPLVCLTHILNCFHQCWARCLPWSLWMTVWYHMSLLHTTALWGGTVPVCLVLCLQCVGESGRVIFWLGSYIFLLSLCHICFAIAFLASFPLFQYVLQWKSWHIRTMWRCILVMNILSHFWLNISTSLVTFLLPELIRAAVTPSSMGLGWPLALYLCKEVYHAVGLAKSWGAGRIQWEEIKILLLLWAELFLSGYIRDVFVAGYLKYALNILLLWAMQRENLFSVPCCTGYWFCSWVFCLLYPYFLLLCVYFYCPAKTRPGPAVLLIWGTRFQACVMPHSFTVEYKVTGSHRRKKTDGTRHFPVYSLIYSHFYLFLFLFPPLGISSVSFKTTVVYSWKFCVGSGKTTCFEKLSI